MEEKITAWIARDENDNLYSFLYEKPIKTEKKTKPGDLWGFWDYKDEGLSIGGPRTIFMLDKRLFPQVKWEDKEPTKVELTIKICK